MLRLFLKLVSRLPLGVLRAMGGAFGSVTYRLRAEYRRKMRGNLRYMGMPEELGLKSAEHVGMLSAESAWIWGRSNADVVGNCDGDEAQLDVLRADLRAGYPIVFMTPHLGCFEASPIFVYERVLKEFGKTFTILYREPKNALIRPFVRQSRTRTGLMPASADLGGVRTILRAMRDGGVLGCLPDQVPGRGEGVMAPFYGHDAFTMTFPLRIAKQCGARCYMAWSIRTSEGRWAVSVRPFSEALSGNLNDDAVLMNREIEKAIAHAPEQYMWNYNRYKGLGRAVRARS